MQKATAVFGPEGTLSLFRFLGSQNTTTPEREAALTPRRQWPRLVFPFSRCACAPRTLSRTCAFRLGALPLPHAYPTSDVGHLNFLLVLPVSVSTLLPLLRGWGKRSPMHAYLATPPLNQENTTTKKHIHEASHAD